MILLLYYRFYYPNVSINFSGSFRVYSKYGIPFIWVFVRFASYSKASCEIKELSNESFLGCFIVQYELPSWFAFYRSFNRSKLFVSADNSFWTPSGSIQYLLSSSNVVGKNKV